MFVKTNRFLDIKEYYFDALSGVYARDEIGVLLEIVSEHFLGFSKMDVKLKSDARLSESELLDFHFTLKRLKNKEPIQYILGKAPFMGLELEVNTSVLIPRPETEELVDWVLQCVSDGARILDIGTGSGCIPLALKSKNRSLGVSALEIDSDALEIAKKNGLKHQLDVNWIQGDVMSKEIHSKLPSNLDCVISNPPYIGFSEMESMESQVKDFEPHLALFVDDSNSLIFYSSIILLAQDILRPGGMLFFEINQRSAEEVKFLMLSNGFGSIEIKRDINNNERMIYGQLLS